MMASYLLSRTLVPTMVLYLLPAEVELYAEGEHGHEHGAGGGPIWRFHRAFNRRSSGCGSAYERLLGWSLDHRAVTLVFAAASPSARWRCPVGRPRLLPDRRRRPVRLHVRAPAGTRIEETERIFSQVEDAIREIIPEPSSS